MHAIGLLDDVKPQSAKLKLGVQVLAAIFVVANGYRFKGLGFRLDEYTPWMEWILGVVSVGWIVGVANSLNFIDGIDGLAG